MSTQSQDINLTLENFLDYAITREFGDIHFKVDATTGLIAIVAIHSTKLGPSLGGCRWKAYDSIADALYDALRLARGMSYKAAVLNIPFGGGKAVILKPKKIDDLEAYFTEFAKFVDSLGGRYITAIDVGTSLHEMDIIAKTTNYIASVSKHDGEPSPYTALGILRGIEAAVAVKFNRDDLQGLHIAIQGVGKVGYHLAKLLHERGARLSIADVNKTPLKALETEINAQIVDGSAIHALDCDVLSPCALGATLNDKTIPAIKAPIIAGSANNQLARLFHGKLLHDAGILYAPDYVISSGGLIYATTMYEGKPEDQCHIAINKIYDSLKEIFERSKKENLPTSEIADSIAKERLKV